MSAQRLIITFPECKFENSALNYISGAADCLLAPHRLTQGVESDFLDELLTEIEKYNISEVTVEATTESKDGSVSTEKEVAEWLSMELGVLNELPEISKKVSEGRLKTSAFVFNHESELFSEVVPGTGVSR